MDLLDRTRAWSVLRDMFTQAEGGDGRAVLVTGVHGMGKTTLLRDIQTHAEALGAVLLTGVASRAERDVPMGVIGQLTDARGLSSGQAAELEGLLEAARRFPAECWDSSCLPPSQVIQVIDSIHGVIRQLAERAFVVITVDDVHEIDPASLHCLLYGIRRVGRSRVLIVLGERTEVPEATSTLTAEFVRNLRCALVHLTPLSRESVASAIAYQVACPGAPPGTVAAWQGASGGNPLLLQALLMDRQTSTAEGQGSAPVTGKAFGLAVQYLVSQVSEPVRRIGHGIALLGKAATPTLVERLMDVDGGGAAPAMGVLDAIGLTGRGQFNVEAARTTVLADMAPACRAALHRKAARLMYADSAASAVVADHLVAGGPVEESWALPTLLNAADQALRTNDAQRAVTLLRAAHEACRDDRQLAAIRAELVQAEWETNPAALPYQLDRMLDDHRSGLLTPRHSMRLAAHLLWQGRPQVAEEVCADLDAVEGRLDGESRTRLEILRIWFAYVYPALGARYVDGAALGGSASAPFFRAADPESEGALLLRTLRSEGPVSGVAETAAWLLQGSSLREPSLAAVGAALTSLFDAAWLDEAAEWCDLLYRDADHRSPTVRAILAAAGAAVETRLGNFEVAGRRADEALNLLSPAAWGIALCIPLSAKVLACMAQGDQEGAAECFRIPLPEAMFETVPGLLYLQARGRYHLSVRRYQAALGDFYACRDLMAAWKLNSSVSLDWQVYAAKALTGLGRQGEAERLLRDCHSEQETGSRRPRERSAPSLERFGGGPRVTVPARSLRDGERERPRTVLRDGPHLAEGLGSGRVEVLSRAEQRVAMLASQGRTNRKIAEELFVTTSTVEQHLTRTYQKLGVRGRSDLPPIMGLLTRGKPARSGM
ncbi:AAA family ATPase [Streptomyces sp. NPDC060209]|uniref:helix-turn-helix transcriptional regulator n=1 Tax=Streptomyces sp. NPDC060209 TaxID=3347073 RepID=UPI003648ACB5